VLEEIATLKTTLGELFQEQQVARSSIWNDSEQWAVVKWAAVVLLALFYPLRFLVLGTKWALKAIRE